MARLNKISTTLTIAASILLEACSSSGTDANSGPAPTPNTTAPQLVATWQSDCIITQNSGSGSTTTQASGGGGGGSGGTSGGEAFQDTVVFNQDGRVAFSTEYYSTSNCNANTLSGTGHYDAVYVIGAPGFDINGSPVTQISYSDSSSTTYSIFDTINGDVDLYLGNKEASTPGQDGSTEANRLDGLGDKLSKQ